MSSLLNQETIIQNVHDTTNSALRVNVVAGSGGGGTTANQGTPAVTADAWPIKVTDGTDTADVTAANALKVDGSAVTQPVSIASPVNVEESHSPIDFERHDYSAVNVTTAAYEELIAATPSDAKIMEIFDSSGQTLVIAFGAAAAEVDQFLVYPGGNGALKIDVPSGTRISIKAVSANATIGEICLNLYS